MLQPRSFLFTRSTPSKTADVSYERARSQRRPRSPPKQDKEDMLTTTTSTTTTDTSSRPTTPSSPLIIPMRGQHERPRSHGRREHVDRRVQSERSRRPSRHVHSPDAIPPSVAALLAITSIPLQKQTGIRRRPNGGQPLTVDAILRHTGVSEKEYGLSLGRNPLDLLLSPPEEDDEIAASETGHGSVTSTRTLSCESIPSLDDASFTEASPGSLLTPSSGSVTPGSASRGRRTVPARRMRSFSSPGSAEDHPLSVSESEIDELDFRMFQRAPRIEEERPDVEMTPPTRKSAFKSNLTASLRALRSAAKSFSSLTTPMITPDDFLTRSIISIDPPVPFTDERMPPRLEDTPTPELRRYLNPTTNAPIEAHVPPSLAQTTSTTKCTASIQMQTYKISRSAKSTSPSVISRRTQSTAEDAVAEGGAGRLARQRDYRENSDFIRIAVLEMLMRKNGKLDDQKPGRAKWALLPRKPPTKPYELAENGVPTRWIALTY